MNQENEITAIPTIGKNIFKLDGPIGRKRFITTLLVLLIANIIVMLITALIILPFGVNIYTFPICMTIASLFLIVALYISILNYIKRFFDIVGRKDRAIFYTLAIQISALAISFIPSIRYLGLTINIVILLFCLLKQGKLIQPTPTQATDEQQV